MAKIILLFLLFTACSSTYRHFDALYGAREYREAYALLRQKPNDSTAYLERELKVLLLLAMEDTQTYLPLLDQILMRRAAPELQDLHNVSRAWIRFISAGSDSDYSNIIAVIPRLPQDDQVIEQIRLIIQAHSLVNLEQYGQTAAYLKVSPLTAGSSDLLYLKGYSHMKLGQNEDAAKDFLALTEITQNPELESLAYYYLGMLSENPDDAVKYMFEAWRLNPYQAEINFELGKMLENGQYQDLHYRFFRASLRLNEDLAESWYRLNI